MILDHVAFASVQWREAFPLFAGALGGAWVSGNEVRGFAPCRLRYSNGMMLELLAPHRVDEDDFLARYLERSGPGLHHLTFFVDDLAQAVDRAEACGRPIVGSRQSFDSAQGWQEVFLAPRSAGGTLIQLVRTDGSWATPPPPDFPAYQAPCASLDVVVHEVTDLDDGVSLYVEALGGRVIATNDTEAGQAVEIDWGRPARIRVLRRRSPAHDHHEVACGLTALEFTCESPNRVPGAQSLPEGGAAVTWGRTTVRLHQC